MSAATAKHSTSRALETYKRRSTAGPEQQQEKRSNQRSKRGVGEKTNKRPGDGMCDLISEIKRANERAVISTLAVNTAAGESKRERLNQRVQY